MGRPRTTTDDEILDAAARVVTRSGPARLTLAGVAGEAGLAAATLVQRFGSKRGLLLALAGRGAAGVAGPFEAAAAAHRSPLQALRAALEAMAAFASTPEELANHLALFEMDLRDPDFHRLALGHAAAMLDRARSLLDAAVAAGELEPCDTARLARAVQVTFNGSLLTWAVHRQGRVQEWVADDMAFLLPLPDLAAHDAVQTLRSAARSGRGAARTQAPAVGPNRSTRMAAAGTPAPSSSSVAASAKPVDPQT